MFYPLCNLSVQKSYPPAGSASYLWLPRTAASAIRTAGELNGIRIAHVQCVRRILPAQNFIPGMLCGFMVTEEDILNAMKEAGKPVSAGDVTKALGADRKEVDKVFDSLKKNGKIVSPVRCKWEPA